MRAGITSTKIRKKTRKRLAREKLEDEKKLDNKTEDKATNTIVGAFFDWQDTLKGYYTIFKQILENYGIPAAFKTDNRTVFYYHLLNEDKRTSEKDVLTQFGYACQQLGVDLTTTSVSQAKGLIERDNGTFQDRLISEFIFICCF